MRGLLAEYKPAAIHIINTPATNSGHTKAFAIAVLPNCQNPIATRKKKKLSRVIILAENTSAFAQSVLSFKISISIRPILVLSTNGRFTLFQSQKQYSSHIHKTGLAPFQGIFILGPPVR